MLGLPAFDQTSSLAWAVPKHIPHIAGARDRPHLSPPSGPKEKRRDLRALLLPTPRLARELSATLLFHHTVRYAFDGLA